MSLPILAYHAIDTSGSVIATDPRWFAATLATLHAEGFRCIDLRKWVDAGRPEVDRSFALAFDDGLASIRLAADALARFNFTATAFLLADRMGRDNAWPGQPPGIPLARILTWREAESIRPAGFRFESHGCSHARLDVLDGRSLGREMRDSRTVIEDRLGGPCRLIAYPYGLSNARVRRAAAGHYAAGFGTRLACATADEDAFAISRVDAYYLRHAGGLRALVAGRLAGRLRARRAARAVRKALVGG